MFNMFLIFFGHFFLYSKMFHFIFGGFLCSFLFQMRYIYCFIYMKCSPFSLKFRFLFVPQLFPVVHIQLAQDFLVTAYCVICIVSLSIVTLWICYFPPPCFSMKTYCCFGQSEACAHTVFACPIPHDLSTGHVKMLDYNLRTYLKLRQLLELWQHVYTLFVIIGTVLWIIKMCFKHFLSKKNDYIVNNIAQHCLNKDPSPMDSKCFLK